MVRQIVRRDREGFEPLVPRESSARGTEGSNPSSSSGESDETLNSFSPACSQRNLYFTPLSRRRGEDGVTGGAPENVKHGDTTDIEITGIATLSNPIVREG